MVWKNFDYLLLGAYPKGPWEVAMSVIMAVIGIFGAFWIGLGVGLMRLSTRGGCPGRPCSTSRSSAARRS